MLLIFDALVRSRTVRCTFSSVLNINPTNFFIMPTSAEAKVDAFDGYRPVDHCPNHLEISLKC